MNYSNSNNKSNLSDNKELINLKNQIINLQNTLKEKDSIIIKLRNELENINKKILKKNELVKRDEVIVLNFSSMDQKVNFAIPSIGTDIFAEIEEILYKHYPKYHETNNLFLIMEKKLFV